MKMGKIGGLAKISRIALMKAWFVDNSIVRTFFSRSHPEADKKPRINGEISE